MSSQARLPAAISSAEPHPARRAPDTEILIAGGGIGGLAAALALARHGRPSHVFERREAFAEEGAGIQIGPNGTKILRELGIPGLLRPRVAAPEGLRIFDGVSGAQLTRLPLGAWIADRHGAPYWTVHRQDLHTALLARAHQEPLVRISTATTITGVRSYARSVAARSEDGRTFPGEVLIAADGLWSGIRASCFGTPGPHFTGKTAFRAVVPAAAVPEGLFRGDVGLWLAPGAHAVHYPVRAGTELAVVVILDELHSGKDWSAPVEPGFIDSRAGLFPEPLRSLVRRPETWRKWALHTMPGQRRFVHGRVALLGDAAHPVLPFLAQGGVLALEDASVLASSLAGAGGDLGRCLAHYERVRRSRSRRVARASRINGRIYHLTGIAATLRNAAMSAMPPAIMMAAYDWLYGWTATSGSRAS